MANNVDFFLDNQQLTLGPIINDDSNNLKPILNFDSIDDEIFQLKIVIINDAIWVEYSKNEKKNERIEYQPTNIEKKIIRNKIN